MCLGTKANSFLKGKIQISLGPTTHMWTIEGRLPSSGGICPLIELLFMWLEEDKMHK